MVCRHSKTCEMNDFAQFREGHFRQMAIMTPNAACRADNLRTTTACQQLIAAQLWGMSRIASTSHPRKEARHASAAGQPGQAACEERQTEDIAAPDAAHPRIGDLVYFILGGSYKHDHDRDRCACGGPWVWCPEMQVTYCRWCGREAPKETT